MVELNKIYHSDILPGIEMLEDESINTIVTSPPYYSVRDYNVDPTKWPEIKYKLFGLEITVTEMTCCLGLEPSPEAFIGHLVLVFRMARMKLRNDGTLWINIGDTYWGGKGKSGHSYSTEYQNERYNKGRSYNGGHHQIGGKKQTRPVDGKHSFIKPKDMVGIPWMLAFALREDGWYLRSEIIWNKPNCMPESIIDRPTKAHEQIFLLSKSHKYYFDYKAIQEPAVSDEIANGFRGGAYTHDATFNNNEGGKRKKSGNLRRKTGAERGCPDGSRSNVCTHVPWEGNTRNKRDVWTVPTQGYKGVHFATFPPKLIVDCIKAGCPEGGVVCDLFVGSGTTAVVSRKLNRNFIGIDANKSYVEDIAIPRIERELGIFK